MKDNYTKEEVIEMLVANNNMTMRELNQNLRFTIDYDRKIVFSEKRILLSNWKKLNEYTYDECIQEVKD